MLQESPNQQFHQGILQGETSGESQELPSHSLTQELPVDGPSPSSSSLQESQVQKERFSRFLTPPHTISSSIQHPVCTTVVPANGSAESFFHLMAGTSKDQVPVAQRFGQSFPKHHVPLCNCYPRFPRQKQTPELPVKNNLKRKGV